MFIRYATRIIFYKLATYDVTNFSPCLILKKHSVRKKSSGYKNGINIISLFMKI